MAGERRSGGGGRLFADDVHDGGGAEVELVEEEVIRMDGLQAQRFECPGGEVGCTFVGRRAASDYD